MNEQVNGMVKSKRYLQVKWYQSTSCWGRHKLDGKRGMTWMLARIVKYIEDLLRDKKMDYLFKCR